VKVSSIFSAIVLGLVFQSMAGKVLVLEIDLPTIYPMQKSKHFSFEIARALLLQRK